ncbi:MAG: hypothetical protein JNK05_05740 [Myxococcales bacterium]|nr:hypothetical protein [Myxococcales bacterium]
MREPNNHQRKSLARQLSKAFPAQARIAALVEDSGLDRSLLDLHGPPDDVWRAVLHLAWQREKLAGLLRVASEQAPAIRPALEAISDELHEQNDPIPQTLIDCAGRGRLIVVLGPEFSALKRPPLAALLADKLEERYDHRGAFNRFTRRRDELTRKLAAVIGEAERDDRARQPVWESIAQIPARWFVDTSFDRGFERSIGAKGALLDRDDLSHASRTVVRTSGDLDHFDRMLDCLASSRERWLRIDHPTIRGHIQQQIDEGCGFLLLGFESAGADAVLGELQELNHSPAAWALFREGERESSRFAECGFEGGEAWIRRFVALVLHLDVENKTAVIQQLAQTIEHYATEDEQAVAEEARRVTTLHNEAKFTSARASCEALLARVEAKARVEPERWRTWVARCQMWLASTLFTMGDPQRAKELLEGIEETSASKMSVSHRASLAEIWALVGRPERGIAILPDAVGVEGADAKRICVARWRIALAKGQILDGDVPDDECLPIDLAVELLRRGQYERSIEAVLPLLRGSLADRMTHKLALSVAVDTIVQALYANEPVLRGASFNERVAFYGEIEGWVDALPISDDGESGQRIIEQCRQTRAVFYEAVGDSVRSNIAPPSYEGDDVLSQLDAFERLKQATTWDEARDALAGSPNDLRRTHLYLQWALNRRDADTARRVLQPLDPALDRHASFLELRSRLAELEGAPDVALDYARAWFDVLPSRGPRARLAKLLVGANLRDEAWRVIEPLKLRAGDNPDWIADRAAAGFEFDPAGAIDRWRLACEALPQSANAFINLAMACYQAGNRTEAADAAWQAFVVDAARVSSDNLLRIAYFQRDVVGDWRERTRRICTLLASRSNQDVTTERALFQLGVLLDEDVGRPVNVRLLEEHGVLHRGPPIDELAKQLARAAEHRALVHHWYRLGNLTFDAYCDDCDVTPARFVAECLTQSSDPSALLSAAISNQDPPSESLSGATVFVGYLELLLLIELNLLDALLDELGAMGRIALERDTVIAITEAPIAVTQFRREVDAPIRAWLDTLRESPRFEVFSDPHDDTSDEEWAKKRGVLLVSSSKTGEHERSVASLASYARHEDLISDGEFAQLSRSLGGEHETADADAWREIRTVALSNYAVEKLAGCGVLEKIARAFHKLLVPPATTRALERKRDEARIAQSMLSLAQRAHQRLGALRTQGRIDEVQLESVFDLATDGEPGIEKSMVDSLQSALSMRAWVSEGANRFALVADWFLFEPRAQAEAWQSLQDVETKKKWLSSIESTQHRVLSMGVFSRGKAARDRSTDAQWMLARLGFADAIDPDQLAARLGAAKSLEALGVRPLFEGLERQLRSFEFRSPTIGYTVTYHRGRTHTAMRLATLYAQTAAVWLRDGSEQQLRLAEALLSRAMKIGDETRFDFLSLLLPSLASEASLEPLFSWFEAEPRRMQALERSIPSWFVVRQSGARWLEKNLDTLTESRIQPDPAVVSLIAEPSRSMSIASALWDRRPFERLSLTVRARGREDVRLSLEALLQRAAKALETRDASVRVAPDGVVVTLGFANGGSVEVHAPLEALVLRLESAEQQRVWLGEYLRWIGPIDAAAARETLHWLDNDTHEIKQDWTIAVRRGAWRQVLVQPTSIQFWSASNAGLAPLSSLDGLAAMLSEAQSPAQYSSGIHAALKARTEDAGPWSSRIDRGSLFAFASASVPGLTGISAWTYATTPDELSFLVLRALRELEAPALTPIGRLVTALLSVTQLASAQPVIRSGNRELDLRQIVADGWADSVRVAVVAALPSDSAQNKTVSSAEIVVRHEASLLRLCSAVVTALAAHRAIPLVDGIWLSWRLYHWLMEVLRPLPHREFEGALSDLVSIAPPPSATLPVDRDLWHPAGLDAFDHRAVAILQAFLTGRAWSSLPADHGDSQPRWSVTLPPDVIDLLVQWAGREFTPFEQARLGRDKPNTVLDWVGPETLPELALIAALDQDSTSLMRLTIEQRGRWLSVLPRRSEQAGCVSRDVATLIVQAVVENVKSLTGAELDTFERFLDVCETSDPQIAESWRRSGFVALFSAGRSNLDARVRNALVAGSARKDVQALFARYLLGVAKETPSRLDSVIDELLSRVVPEARIVLVLAPAVIVLEGNPSQAEAAVACLRRVASMPEFAQNDRVKDVVRRLGISQ